MLNLPMRMTLAAVLVFTVAGCSNSKVPDATIPPVRYFVSPQDAVETTSWLLKQKDWEQLASYYDVSEGSLTRQQLASGEPFTRQGEADAEGQPTVMYVQPFPPEYRFVKVEDTANSKIKRVIVAGVAVEGQTERPTDEFLLRRSSVGYQLLPESAPR